MNSSMQCLSRGPIQLTHLSRNQNSLEEAKKNERGGNSLAVQWLGLGAFTSVAWVQSLVGEVRSCKPRGTAKKKKKKKER